MLLAEPPQTQYDLHLSVAGIPVRVHPFFWLVALILGARGGDGMHILIWIVVLFFSILIHELGHAFTMRWYGEYPFVVLYMMGGLAISGSPGGYGRARHSRGWLQQIIISAAGPAAGFLLAAVTVALVHLAGGAVDFDFSRGIYFWRVQLPQPNPYMYDLVNTVMWINILWGLVNLMPVYPLDGGQIARQLFMLKDPWNGIRDSLWLSIVTAVVIGVCGMMFMHSIFIAAMFGLLAYSNWQMLQYNSGGGHG